MQTLVALLLGDGAAPATPTDKPTTEGATDSKDSAQPDPASLVPLAVALPVSMHPPEPPKPLPNSELSQVEAMLGEASKTPAVATTLIQATLKDTLDTGTTKTDTKAEFPATQPFPAAMDAAQSTTTTSTAAAPQSAPLKQLHSTVGTSAWSSELSTQLAWMVDKGHQAASLRLSPEHLGPLEVRIDMHDGQANVWFGATHADTRAAIEQSLPRLRELFAAQGLALNDAGVFQQAPREQAKQSFRGNSNAPFEGDGNHTLTAVSTGLGLLDAYA